MLIPCSDLAAYTIDNNELPHNNRYIIPGFSNHSGMVVELMDKYAQYEFVQKLGLKCAKSWTIDLNSDFRSIVNVIDLPCIVKPQISAFGKKDDITICHSSNELCQALVQFQKGNYKRAIVQVFLEKKYEICSFGCITNQCYSEQSHAIGCIVKKIREARTGSTAFAQVISDSSIQSERNGTKGLGKRKIDIPLNELELVKSVDGKLLEKLFNLGYRGFYDIEYFVCDDGVYVNEINFRQSGNGYVLPKYGIHVPCIVVDDLTNRAGDSMSVSPIPVGRFHMDEASDVFNIKRLHISFVVWICQFFTTKAKAIFDVHDISGTTAFYRSVCNYLFRKLRKN